MNTTPADTEGTEMTTNLVKPTNCRRCGGKGFTPHHHVDFGRCFACGGAGLVEGDKATIASAKAYVSNRTALGRAAFAAGHAAHSGLSLLEANEPERCRKAVASFAAGRTDVIPALEAYFAAISA